MYINELSLLLPAVAIVTTLAWVAIIFCVTARATSKEV
jgi:hypothetical protein